MYKYYDLDDLREQGIKDLREIGETASLALSAFSGYRIRISDDQEYVFAQYISSGSLHEITMHELHYFSKDNEEIKDILNLSEEDIDNEPVPGFRIDGELFILDEFIRDDYGKV